MKTFDVILNSYFVFLCLLFVTGGFVPAEGSPHARLLSDLSHMGPWVAGFLVLTVWRRIHDRHGTFAELRFVGLLSGLGDRLSTARGAIYLLAGVWALLLVAVSIRRHLAFDDNGDLAIFDQAFWNTIRGNFVRSTLVPNASREVTIFSDHFDPLQLVLVPFYMVFPSPTLLLAAQGIMLALGALPLSWLARHCFPGRSVLAAIFPILYLLYLPLRGANRYDYHPGALVPSLFLFALYFLEKQRWTPMTLLLVMAGLLKENMPMAGAMIGIYLVLAKQRRLLGLVLFASFSLWSYAGFAWIIPAFNPAGYPHLLRYSVFAGQPSSFWLAPIVRPTDFFTALFAFPTRKLIYVINVFGPVAFLPFLSPSRLLLGLPFLAQNLLSAVPHQTSLGTHHAAELIPFVFFAAVSGASKVLHWLDAKHAIAALREGTRPCPALAALLLASSFLFHGVPETFYLRSYSRTAHHERLSAVLQTIPAEAPLATWTEIAPHVAHRRALYRFPALGPDGTAEAELVILDETLVGPNRRATFAEAVAALPSKGYEKILDEDGILLFRKQMSGHR
jgi:uncharacterized membrane protein